MALRDSLQRQKQQQEEDLKRRAHEKGDKQAAQQIFNQEAEKKFDEVVVPKIKEMIKDLNDFDYPSHLGQDVQRVTQGGRTESFTISKKGTRCKLQVDIHKSNIHQSIIVGFHSTGSIQHINEEIVLTLEEITADKIDELVEQYVSELNSRCPQ